MITEIKQDGTKVYGTEYSGVYVTINPAPKVWNVLAFEDYNEINQYRDAMREEMGLPLGFGVNDSSQWEVATSIDREAKNMRDSATLATFATRKAARGYIESIGGTWK